MTALANQNEADGSKAFSGPAADRAIRFADLELSLLHEPASIEADWRRLERREWISLNQTFDWCSAWFATHDASECAIVTGAIGSRILFILPLEISDGRLGRTARFPGGRFNNLNTGLFDDALAAPGSEDLIHFRQALAEVLNGKADLLVLEKIPLYWKGISHPLRALASVESQNHSFQLPLLGTMDATLAQINAKTRRKKFRNQTRKLEALGGFEHLVATTSEDQHRLLDRFFAQKGARLRAFGLPDVFAPAPTRMFFHRLLDSPEQEHDKPLAMHALRLKGAHEGHIAAITGLSRKGSHVLCQFSSIDGSVGAEASPGELLFWLAVERSVAEDATLFDFGIGDQLYKRNWCSQETIQHDIVIPISVSGRLLAPMLVALTRIKSMVKKHPRLYALAQRWLARH
jgi:CelD/BcsL family acetyltransferase involved in cellulose biosynthesis